MVIRWSFLLQLPFTSCFAMLIRWADLIVLLLMIAFFLSQLLFVVCFAMVNCWAGSFLLWLPFVFCSATVIHWAGSFLLAILLRSSPVLLDVFLILLGCYPFAILLRAAILDSLVCPDGPFGIYDHNVPGTKTGTWKWGIGMLKCWMIELLLLVMLKLWLRREIDCYSNLENVPKNL